MSDPTPADRTRQPIPLFPTAHRTRLAAPLPVPLTSFVGREREVEQVCGLLRRPDTRLVTLTGPGGVGKTRLALQVAAELAADFVDGVVFVDVAPLAEPALVAPTIARAITVREVNGRPLTGQLIEALGDRQVLLVLDNFEQVVDAAPLLVELLVACPQLTMLVTSRRRLRVSGEHAFVVPSLALAEGGDVSSLADVTQAASTDLFVARAMAADPAFSLTEANAAAVAQLCRHLDGLPLAIELAAARVPILPPHAMLARLTQEASARLPLLADGPRDVPARQRTLRSAIAWSYDLLSTEERAIFRRLAVFVGGFTLAAAETVTGLGPQDAVSEPESSVLGVIASLADASLLQRMTGSESGSEVDTPRYGMLETVREFGLEALAAAAEEAETRTSHAAFCLALAERDQQTMAWQEMAEWFATLQAEHDNLRAALAWLEHSDAAGMVRLASRLAWFWLYRSHRAEGRRWLERAISAAQEAPVPDGDRAWALHGAALLTRSQNDPALAERLGEEALDLYRGIDDAWGTAVTLNLLAGLARSRGSQDAARAFGEEALALFEALGMARWVARAQAHLGIVANRQGDDAAEGFLQAALSAHRDLNDQMGSVIALHWLAVVTADRGDLGRAAALEREGLVTAGAAGAQEALLDGLAGLATIATGLGQLETAARLLGAAGAHGERLGYTFERPEHERYLLTAQQVREALGDAAYSQAEAIGRALSLDEAVAEAMSFTAAKSTTVTTPTGGAARYGLTAREVEVLGLLAQRRTDREIADALFISPKTAGFHVANILGKLGVANRREAATLALRESLTGSPT